MEDHLKVSIMLNDISPLHFLKSALRFWEENKQNAELMELEMDVKSEEVSKAICRSRHKLNTFPVLNLHCVRTLLKAVKRRDYNFFPSDTQV